MQPWQPEHGHRGIESARTNVQEQLVAFLHDWLSWVAVESCQASGGVGAREFGETIALAGRIPVEHSGASLSRWLIPEWVWPLYWTGLELELGWCHCRLVRIEAEEAGGSNVAPIAPRAELGAEVTQDTLELRCGLSLLSGPTRCGLLQSNNRDSAKVVVWDARKQSSQELTQPPVAPVVVVLFVSLIESGPGSEQNDRLANRPVEVVEVQEVFDPRTRYLCFRWSKRNHYSLQSR